MKRFKSEVIFIIIKSTILYYSTTKSAVTSFPCYMTSNAIAESFLKTINTAGCGLHLRCCYRTVISMSNEQPICTNYLRLSSARHIAANNDVEFARSIAI